MGKKMILAFISMLLLVSLLTSAGYAAEITVTDIAGRTITLKAPAQRIVLGEGRYITTLGLLDRENPVKRVVGMLNDLRRGQPKLAKQLKAKYPEFSKIKKIGLKSFVSVSAEKILTLKPDLAIFGIHDHGPGTRNKELIGLLTKAGIAVVFIDFRLNPLENTVPSIALLGKILGREKEANEYISFYQSKLEAIKQRVAKIEGPKPKVFLQAHVGRFDCCVAMASGMLGPFIGIAGGINISAKVSPGPTGRHTMEFVISENPDVWIGTASGTMREIKAGKAMIFLGSNSSPEIAKSSLQKAIKALSGLETTAALKNKRIHGIWHNYYNSPYNIVALEAFAKWLHPEEFSDLDPEQTMKEIYEKFLPFDLDGIYTVSLEQ